MCMYVLYFNICILYLHLVLLTGEKDSVFKSDTMKQKPFNSFWLLDRN